MNFFRKSLTKAKNTLIAISGFITSAVDLIFNIFEIRYAAAVAASPVPVVITAAVSLPAATITDGAPNGIMYLYDRTKKLSWSWFACLEQYEDQYKDRELNNSEYGNECDPVTGISITYL